MPASKPEEPTTVKLKYTGYADLRIISAADFKKVGVDDQTVVTVDLTGFKTDRTVDVSEKAANYLLDKESATWELVKDEEAPEPEDS